MTYVDDDGGMVTETCLYHCAPGRPAPCEGADCECGCHRSSEPYVDPERARELDNRPAAALENLARDMEAESRPDVAELVAERFGRPTRGRA